MSVLWLITLANMAGAATFSIRWEKGLNYAETEDSQALMDGGWMVGNSYNVVPQRDGSLTKRGGTSTLTAAATWKPYEGSAVLLEGGEVYAATGEGWQWISSALGSVIRDTVSGKGNAGYGRWWTGILADRVVWLAPWYDTTRYRTELYRFDTEIGAWTRYKSATPFVVHPRGFGRYVDPTTNQSYVYWKDSANTAARRFGLTDTTDNGGTITAEAYTPRFNVAGQTVLWTHAYVVIENLDDVTVTALLELGNAGGAVTRVTKTLLSLTASAGDTTGKGVARQYRLPINIEARTCQLHFRMTGVRNVATLRPGVLYGDLRAQ